MVAKVCVVFWRKWSPLVCTDTVDTRRSARSWPRSSIVVDKSDRWSLDGAEQSLDSWAEL